MFKVYRKLWGALLLFLIMCPLGLLATGTAFGEWGTDELLDEVGFIPRGLASYMDTWQYPILPDYTVSGFNAGFAQSAAGYILSALIGVILVAGIMLMIGKRIRE
ncbi:PDGLE domain-containing protein [Syntrophomonas erecta]